MSTTRTWTDEELMSLPDDGCKRELVDGEIVVMNAAGGPHGKIILRLAHRLAGVIERDGLGHLFDGQTGFRLPSGNLRMPDIAFVSRERLARVRRGLLHVVPDLAVEVLSPDDSARQVLHKVAEYVQAGVRLTWVIDPEGPSALAFRSLGSSRSLGASGELDGEDVVPGFRCRLAELVEDIDLSE